MSVFIHPAEAEVRTAMQAQLGGRLTDAEDGYRRILDHHPGDPLATHLLGLVVGRLGRPAESVDLLEAAVATGQPPLAFFLAWIDAAINAKLPDRAIAAARRTVAAFPHDPTAADRLARVEAGREPPKVDAAAAKSFHQKADASDAEQNWAESIAFRRIALAARHHDPIGHKKLAATFARSGRTDEAIASFRTALSQCPGDVEAMLGIGLVFFHADRIPEALAQLRELTRTAPGFLAGWSNLTMVESSVGDYQSAMSAVRAGVNAGPEDQAVRSLSIVLMNYCRGDRLGIVLEESKKWAAKFAPPPALAEFPMIDRDPDRPLRIGFVSPDFRNHSVCFFAASVLGRRDRRQFRTTCYAEVTQPDEMTERVKAVADGWRSTVGLTDEEVAAAIRQDRIDILIDLCGHLQGNRLTAMARRPAPVQMTWLGYPNTTAVPAIDYRITDGRADPTGTLLPADDFYTEKLIRLPDAFFAYTPIPNAPPVAPLPMSANGYPTFGVFHGLQKVSDKSADLWAAAMKAVPTARLLWVGVVESVRPLMLEKLTRRGVDRVRVEFAGKLSLADFLAVHGRVDIALDAFPWAGHTTTCHGLWMGVPTLTLAGPTAVSRAGVSVLGALGLESEWVAGTAREFEAFAAARAADSDALEQLRSTLRDRMAKSPLTDTAGFTRNFESALRGAWRNWCREQKRPA